MKKIMIIIAAFLTAANAMSQDITASLTIQLKSQSNATSDMYLYEASDFTNPIDVTNSVDCFVNTTNTSNVNVFALLGEVKYAQFAAKTISNLPIGIITNREAADAQNYQLIFSDVEGRNLKFVDKVMEVEQIIPAEGFTYNFTVNTTNCPSYVEGTNVTIADRFFLEPFNPEPGDLQVCHVGDNLEIKANPFATNIVVKDSEGEKVLDVLPQATPQVISLAKLAKGRYTVEFNEGKEVFVIEVKPDVTPAN